MPHLDRVGHPHPRSRPLRPVRAPRRSRRDPDCPLCHGSGTFRAIGKGHPAPVSCPSCRAPPMFA